MSRFVNSNSPLFQIVGWFFVATLFSDGANLDDIFLGSVVLHDDYEVIGADPGACAESSGLTWGVVHESAGISGIRQSVAFLRNPLRVIIDQDSLSLAADRFGNLFQIRCNLDDSPNVPIDCQLSSKPLYIRFCSLLI